MNEPKLTTPVVLIVFNRLGTARRVFQTIAQARPTKLLIIADGPRTEKVGEAEACKSVRQIFDTIDWDCEVLTNYSEVNLGCKKRVSSGLDWVFSLVEEAIILEDDCLPDSSFFEYCQELLERYRFDTRIGMVAGSNPLPPSSRNSDSYHFSRYPLIWGWATWRRVWQNYDVTMMEWPRIRKGNWLVDILGTVEMANYWGILFDQVHQGKIDTWDYQFVFACFIQNQMAILPSINLIANIGFGEEATHTRDDSNNLSNLPTSSLKLPLSVPKFPIKDREADALLEMRYFSQPNILRRVFRRIRRLLAC